MPLNLGWTVGEEILFKNESGKKQKRQDFCRALTDSCVLGIEKNHLMQMKKVLYERGGEEEFNKIGIVLRGN